MRIAYLDCFSGISGDMFLGTLIDAGVPLSLLQDTVAALNIDARLEVSHVMRSGISATKADVIVNGKKDVPLEVASVHEHDHVAPSSSPVGPAAHDHEHSHEHEHDHEHHHDHEHDHGHTHSHDHGRSLSHIRELIRHASIKPVAKERAIAMFEALGAAEARIHQVPVENIHFHEVGSADAIVDIVCAAVGSVALGVDEWVCSPLNVGGGTVECAHGTFPIPAPATVELLKKRNAPVYSSGVQMELVTPTGAAIVNVLANRFGSVPAMRTSAVGYGAGFRELQRQPNVLRLTIGETDENTCVADDGKITVLEANIDDLNPQIFGYLIDRALAEGALDVFTTPVQMKKSRSGVLLTMLCNPQDRDKLARLIFAETSTLGIRIREDQRYCLTRRHVAVQTQWGEIRMKLGSLDGTVTNYHPEYEDCRRVAEEHKVPLKTVMQEAVRQYLEQHHE